MIDCPKCGWKNPDNAQKCAQCFEVLRQAPAPPPPQQTQVQQPYPQQTVARPPYVQQQLPPQTQYYPPQQQPYPGQAYPGQQPYGYPYQAYANYAGFWIRFAAQLIDGFVMFVVGIGIGLALGVSAFATSGLGGHGNAAVSAAGTVANLLSWTVGIAYIVGMNTMYGATLGKMAVGIRIVRSNGSPISFGIALARHLLQSVFAVFTCGLAYIAVAVNIGKQGWHDQIVDTVVIHSR